MLRMSQRGGTLDHNAWILYMVTTATHRVGDNRLSLAAFPMGAALLLR